jgi:hypothetical protein
LTVADRKGEGIIDRYKQTLNKKVLTKSIKIERKEGINKEKEG